MTSTYVDDDSAWFAWDGENSVRMSCMEIPAESRERSVRSSAAAHWESFSENMDGESVGREVKWDEKTVSGRAAFRKVDFDGEDGFLLQGVVSTVQKLAICTVVIHDESDFDWAEGVMRSVEMADSAD
jgi:hypothetical protein